MNDLKKEVVTAIASAMECGDERVKCFGTKALRILKDDESLDTLLKYLNDTDPDVRCDSAMALGKIGSDAAVPYLIKALNEDEDPLVKVSAMDALSEIGDSVAIEPIINAITSTPSFLSALGDMSWDYRWDIQEKGISALGRFKDSKAVDTLIGFLKDEEMETMQGLIFKSLIQQGDKRGIETVAEYLKDKDVAVRRKSASAFTHADNPDALKYLADAVIDDDSLVKISAVRGIGKLGAEKDIVPLVLLLKDEDEEVRIESIKAIKKILGGKSVKHIIPLLNDRSNAVKKAAVELIGEIGTPECVEPLLKALDCNDDDILSEAITALGKYDNERIKDAMLGIITNKDKASFVRNKALRVLKIKDDKKGLDTVLEILKSDTDKSIKDAAFDCLKCADEEVVMDAVSELTESDDADIKVSIAKLFKEFKDIKSERILLNFLSDENVYVKIASAISLAYNGNDAGMEIIKEVTGSMDNDLKCEICDALKNIKNEQAVNFLISCLENKDPFLRYAAVKSVGSAGLSMSPHVLSGEQSVNSLIRLLDDENKDVRREAVIALGRIANESILFLLVSRLYDYERFNDLRKDVVSACKNINQEETVIIILDTLNDRHRKDDHWTVIEALSSIYGEKNRDACA